MGIKINQPIGPNVWAPFLIRLALGAYFILAGLGKLEVLAAFIEQVKGFGLLPHNVSALYATLLPYGEVALGGMMIVGLWTTLTGIVSGLLILSFVALAYYCDLILEYLRKFDQGTSINTIERF